GTRSTSASTTRTGRPPTTSSGFTTLPSCGSRKRGTTTTPGRGPAAWSAARPAATAWPSKLPRPTCQTTGGAMAPADVIVPCYRYGHFLEGCVRSALAQTGVEDRVLVLDDASPDDTEAVGRRLAG